jgi:hypothetical protein
VLVSIDRRLLRSSSSGYRVIYYLKRTDDVTYLMLFLVTVYLGGFIVNFWLPEPQREELPE